MDMLASNWEGFSRRKKRTFDKTKEKTMKQILMTIACIFTAFSLPASADHHSRAMEFFACNFNDGKDMSDLMKVTEEWREFAEENFSETYQAGVMTP